MRYAPDGTLTATTYCQPRAFQLPRKAVLSHRSASAGHRRARPAGTGDLVQDAPPRRAALSSHHLQRQPPLLAGAAICIGVRTRCGAAGRPAPLRIGQRLLIPGLRAAQPQSAAHEARSFTRCTLTATRQFAVLPSVPEYCRPRTATRSRPCRSRCRPVPHGPRPWPPASPAGLPPQPAVATAAPPRSGDRSHHLPRARLHLAHLLPLTAAGKPSPPPATVLPRQYRRIRRQARSPLNWAGSWWLPAVPRAMVAAGQARLRRGPGERPVRLRRKAGLLPVLGPSCPGAWLLPVRWPAPRRRRGGSGPCRAGSAS